MKLLARLVIFCFIFDCVLGENVIDNKVSTRGEISTLEISSAKYKISNIELIGSGNTNKNDWILAENGKY